MAANGSDVCRKVIESNQIKIATAVLNCNKFGTITTLDSSLVERFPLSGVTPSTESRLDGRFDSYTYYT